MFFPKQNIPSLENIYGVGSYSFSLSKSLGQSHFMANVLDPSLSDHHIQQVDSCQRIGTVGYPFVIGEGLDIHLLLFHFSEITIGPP
jgi:hypothetical protein